LGGVFLAGLEVEAVELKEENADYETSPLITIDKRMVAHDTGRVESGHLDDVARSSIRVMLEGTSQGGLQKTSIAQSRRTAVNIYKAVMDRDHVPFLDPERLFSSGHR
jgi:hypothetical protein